MLAASPLVRLAGIGKTFPDGTRALSGISLDLADGEFLSLLGPSGCGKSTLLRLIAGLTPPTEGRIHWPRSTGGGPDQTRPRLGFVFQDPTLMPWARVLDNVALPLRLAGLSRRDASPAAMQALDHVGLAAAAGTYPRQLSGGMRMRVAIARALVTQPRLLLLDEPFAALDEITRLKLNDDLLRLWQDRRLSVVFVTHSVYESVFLSSRIAVLATRPGRLHATVDVPAAYPRGEEFRTGAEYNALCRLTSAALRAAMAAP